MKIILVVLTGLLLSTSLLAAQSNDLKISVTTTNANGYTEDTWTTKILDAQAKALLNFALDNTKQAFLNNGGKAKDWTPKHTYSSNPRKAQSLNSPNQNIWCNALCLLTPYILTCAS